MSKKENNTETPKQDQEKKVVTRYDRRIQKRKEQEEKRKRDHKITMAISIAILVAAVALIVSFPIRNFTAVHSTFIEVGGKKITRVEFDYNYYVTLNNYYNQMSYLLPYLGVDFSGDLSTQMYSEDLSWQDYLQELTVDRIKTNQSLLQEARSAGFTYDTSADYAEFQQFVEDGAKENGVSVASYLKSAYGSLATMGRLEDFVKESFYAAAYQDSVSDQKTPSDDEINAYYEENKDSYDSVDYRMVQVDAVLPTEPTELADPVEESEEADESEDGTEEAYQPSEAEIEAAMEVAQEEAQEKEKTIGTDGELTENAKMSSLNYLYSDWLMDETRKEGDTTTVEDNTNHRYYVVQFVKRYRDDAPTVNARVISTDDHESAEAVMTEWESGEATEARFIELYHQYSTDTSMEDGFYEGITKLNDETLDGWLYAEERQPGDVSVLDAASEENGHFVMYYVGKGQPEWYYSIRSTMLSTAMSDYLDEISADCQVVDRKGNLRYLIVESLEAEASAEAAQDSTETAQDGSTEPADAEEGTDAGTEGTDAG